MLSLNDDFRELFLSVVGFVLFWGVVLALPPFLWALSWRRQVDART